MGSARARPSIARATTLRFFAARMRAPARLVLSLRQPPHRRARVGQRTVLDRHGAAPGRRADGPPVLRRRGGNRAARRRDLPPRRFRWMLAGDPLLLSHGWKPESGFLRIALGPLLRADDPLPARDWIADASHSAGIVASVAAARSSRSRALLHRRPAPLFVHQFSHAWVDFRGLRERESPHTDWWQNSVTATRAHKAFCLKLSARVPGLRRERLGHHRFGQPPAATWRGAGRRVMRQSTAGSCHARPPAR